MIDEFGCAGVLQGLSVFVCVCVRERFEVQWRAQPLSTKCH